MWRAWIRSWKSQHAREAALQQAKREAHLWNVLFDKDTSVREERLHGGGFSHTDLALRSEEGPRPKAHLTKVHS